MREIIHGVSAKIADRADFSPAPVCVLVTGHGDSAGASTPRNCSANVAFRPPARVSPRGKMKCPCCRNAPSAQCPLRCLFSPNPMGSTPAKQKRSRLFPNSIAPHPFCRDWSPFRQNGKTPPITDRRRLAQGGAAIGSSEVNAGGKKPRRHCQRGSRPHWFAMIGFLLRSRRRLRRDDGSIVAQLFHPPRVSAPPDLGNTAAIISEETRTGQRCVREFRAPLYSLRRVAGRLCREIN